MSGFLRRISVVLLVIAACFAGARIYAAGSSSLTYTLDDDGAKIAAVPHSFAIGSVTQLSSLPYKPGYGYGGHYTGTRCTGNQIIDHQGNLLISLDAPTTLYACWVPYNPPSVVLDDAGGAGGKLSNNGCSRIYRLVNGEYVEFASHFDWAINDYNSKHWLIGCSGTDIITSMYQLPTRSGYTFKGYYTGQNGTGTQIVYQNGTLVASESVYSTLSASVPTTIYAYWESDYSGNYLITLNDAGGSGGQVGSSILHRLYEIYGECYAKATGININTGQLTNEECILSIAQTPTKTGYNFGGYYTGQNGSGALIINSSGTIVGSNTQFTAPATIYAKWTPKVLTVTLNHNGATNSPAPSTVYLKYATGWYSNSGATTSITNMTRVPTKTNYTFAGYWTTNASSGGTRIIDADGHFETTSAALQAFSANGPAYARWVANSSNPTPVWVTVTINDQSATTNSQPTVLYRNTNTAVSNCSGYKATQSCSATTVTSITPPTKTNYTYGGHYTGTGGAGSQWTNANGTILYNVTANTTVYAKWTSNSGSVIEVTLKPGTGGSGNRTIYEKQNVGWFRDSAGSYQITSSIFNSQSSGGAGLTRPTHSSSYTFNGYWTASSGGTQVIDADGYILAEPTYTYTPDTETRTIIFYAQWVAPSTSKIKLNPNNGVVCSVDVVEATFGQPMPTVSCPPTRTNYVFTGYFDAASGGTQYYTDELQSARNWDKTDADSILYAHWEAVPTYNIYYYCDKRDIELGVAGASYTDYGVTYGQDYMFKTRAAVGCSPLSGKKFLGWTDDEHGNSILYQPGQVATYPYHSDARLMAYDMDIGTVTLNHDDPDNTPSPSTVYLVPTDAWYNDSNATNEISTMTTVPVKYGYDFLGYYGLILDGTEGVETKIIDENGDFINVPRAALMESDLDAHYSAKKYPFTLNDASATTASAPNPVTYIVEVGWINNTSGTTITSITIPTKTGNSFAGFWTGPNGTGTKIINADGTFVTITSGILQEFDENNVDTLYAKWNPKNTVTFSCQNQAGDGSGTPSPATVYVADGETLTFPSMANCSWGNAGMSPYVWGVVSGNTFTDTHDAGDTITWDSSWGDRTYNMWYAPNYFNYEYSCDAGSGTPPASGNTYYHNGGWKTAVNTCTAPANKHFVGWLEPVSGVTYAENTTPTGGGWIWPYNVTAAAGGAFVAQWELNTFNVVYANGGGSGNAPAGPTSCTSGQTCNAAANTYTAPTGKVFNGWACTASSGNCASASYAAGESIADATSVNGATITLTAQWITPPTASFTVTTTNLAANTTFTFNMSAAGDFYVDWGDGTIEHITNVDATARAYSHTYTSAGVKTIGFSGQSTSYDSSDASIRFGTGQYYGLTEPTATLVAGVSGSIGSVFPTLGQGDTLTPSFHNLFLGCSNLTGVIPATLFNGVTGARSNMFRQTFRDTGITSIPANLFSGVSGAADYMFAGTFSATDISTIPAGLFNGVSGHAERLFYSTFANCVNLSSIPTGLFSNVSGADVGMFAYTFAECTGLTGNAIPATLFSGVSGAADFMFNATFQHTGITTIPETLFSGVSGAADYMFSQTFISCTGLTSIPAGLFSGVSGTAEALFYGTFANCYGLTGYIPSTLFRNVVYNANNSMMYQIFLETGLATSCDSYDLTQYTTGFESYWNGKVSCAPAALFSCVNPSPNTGGSGTITSSPIFVEPGEAFTFPASTGCVAPTHYNMTDFSWTCDEAMCNNGHHYWAENTPMDDGWPVNQTTSVQFYAHYQGDVYTVTLNPGTGGVAGTLSAVYEKYNSGKWSQSSAGGPFAAWAALTTGQMASRLGYDLTGYWSQDGNTKYINADGTLADGIGSRTFGANTTIYAGWTPKTYTIGYTLNGGTAGANAPTSAAYDSVVNISNPTHAHATFTGWTVAGMDNGVTHYYGTGNPPTSTTTGTSITTPTKATYYKNLRSVSGTVTFTAVWECNAGYTGTNCNTQVQYPLTWSCGDASGTPSGASFPTTITYGGTLTFPSNPCGSIVGHTFTGWVVDVNATRYNVGSTLIWPFTSGSAITAHYEPVKVNITYSCGTGATGTTPAAQNNIDYGSQVTLRSLGNCAMNGFYATRWLVSNTSPTDNYEFGATVDHWNYTENKNLVPNWTAQTYTITYNLNGGTQASSGMPNSYTYSVGATINGVPTKEGATFGGWCTSSDLSNCTTSPIVIGPTEMGPKTYWAKWYIASPAFSVTTTEMSANTTFAFAVTAAGTFYVDWGDGVVEKITRTSTDREFFVHTYSAATTDGYTISFAGLATNYSTVSGSSVIQFGCIEDQYSQYGCTSNGVSLQPTLIKGISGTLGQIFPTINSGGTYKYPRFTRIFANCTNLEGSIPSGLFAGVTGGTTDMYKEAFFNCSNLTGSIPSTLFSGASGSGTNMFWGTFYGCSGLSGNIPEGLFSNVSGSASYMFNATFHGCSGLTGPIPANLFQYISGTGNYMFNETFYHCSGLSSFVAPTLFRGVTTGGENLMTNIFAGSGIATSCPTGYGPYITGFESYWDNKVSCAPSYTITLDNANATTNGTGTLYNVIPQAVYRDSAYQYSMATNSNPITIPARSYTVSFNANGGSVSPLSAIATYTFNGYDSAASNGTNYINASGYLTQNGLNAGKAYTDNTHTWYAKWSSGSVTLPTPTHPHASFAGWYDAETGGNQVTSPYTPTSNKMLYAHWTADTYTIMLEAEGYDGTLPAVYETYNTGWSQTLAGTPGAWVQLTAAQMASKPGYTLLGYYSTASGTGTKYINGDGTLASGVTPTTFGESTTLHARWQANTYNVTYLCGTGATGTAPAATTATYNANFTPASVGGCTNPGRSFAGWLVVGFNLYDSTANTTGKYYNASLSYVSSSGIKLSDYMPVVAGQTYIWKTFNKIGSGGVVRINWFDKDKNILSQNATSSGTTSITVTAPANASYARFSFSPTYFGVAEHVFARASSVPAMTAYESSDNRNANIAFQWQYVGGDKTFIAQWTDNTYTITFHPGDGVTTTGTTEVQEWYSHAYRVQSGTGSMSWTAVTEITLPTKTGYTFAGYYDNPSFTGTPVMVDATLPVTTPAATYFTADADLYAKWAKTGYTVTYKNGGGTGDDVVQDVTYDTQFTTKPGSIFTKTNYVVTKWNTTSGGTYPNLNSGYTYSTAGNTVLTANWGACQCTKGTHVASCDVTGVENNTCQYSYTCETGYNNAGATSGTFNGTTNTAANTSPNCGGANSYTITVTAGNGISKVAASGWTNSGTASMTKTFDFDEQIDLSTVVTATQKSGYTGAAYTVTNGAGSISGNVYTVGADNGTITVSATGITTPAGVTITGGTTKVYNLSATTLTGATTTTYDSGITVKYSFGYAPSSNGTYANWTTASTTKTTSIAKDAFLGTRYYKVRVTASDGTLTSTTTTATTPTTMTLDQKKITFNATTNGGTLSGTSPLYVRYDSENVYTGATSTTTGTVPTASKTGYEFNGWYTEQTGGSQIYNASGTLTSETVSEYTGSSKWRATEDKTLYAQFSANTNTPYKVYHYTKNLTGTGYTLNGAVDNLTGTSNASVTLESLARALPGFTYDAGFEGTATHGTTKPSSGAVTTTTILPDGTRVIDLYYNRNSYTITYKNGGGTGSDVTQPGISYMGSFTTKPGTTFTKTNSIMTGWNTTSGGNYPLLNHTYSEYDTAGNTVLTAAWATCGCTPGTGVATCTTSATATNTCAATVTCASGYDQSTATWSCSGASCSSSCSADDFEITLDNANATTSGTAKIYTTYGVNVYLDANRSKVMTTSANPITKPERVYTVTYNGNNGTVGTTTAANTTATYTFKGYYSAATNGTQYIVGSTGRITSNGITAGKGYSANATWYAQWTSASVTLPNATRAGYTFAGWYDKATGGNLIGAAGATYTPTADKTLYAHWNECTAGNYCDGTGTVTSCSTATNDKYPHSAAGSTSINDCYLTTTAGKYVATAGAGEVQCVANDYCAGGVNVYYGGTHSTTHPTKGGNASCSSGTDNKYNYSEAGTSTVNNCYLTLTTGKYVATAGAGMTNCAANNYSDDTTTKIYYGGTASSSHPTTSSCAACSTLGGGLYNKSAGGTGSTGCYVTTTAGKYIVENTDTTQTTCPVKKYCESAPIYWPNVGQIADCPVADATTAMTSYPSNYYNPTLLSISNQDWSTGITSINGCMANYSLRNARGDFTVSSVKYNSTSGKYDNGGSKYYRKINAGYYGNERYSATYCDTATHVMLYKDALPCPEGSYCPGLDSMPLCSSGTYAETIGLYSCPTNYPDSAAMSTNINACYLTTTAGKYVATAGDGEVQCTANNYCTGGVVVHYDEIGGITACSTGAGSNYATSAAGSDSNTDCYKTVTLDKNGGSGTIQGTSGTNPASVVCHYNTECNFGSASGLTQTGYTFSGGWGTTSTCSGTTVKFTVPNDTGTYYACKSGQSKTCNPGYYLKADNATCTACPAGKYCEGGTFTFNGTDQGITGNIAAGYYANGCAKTSGGAVCSTSYSGGMVSGGYYSTGGGTSATPTTAGNGCLSGNTCGKLSAPYYSNGGSKANNGTCVSGQTCGTCNSNYRANTATGKTVVTQCQTQCAAGQQVATANAACSTPSGSWYTAQHLVNYGSKSSDTSGVVKSCTTNYATANTTTQTDHDAQNDCKRTITLDKNGGTGTVDASIECSEGVVCDLPDASGLTQTGYTFAGSWSTTSGVGVTGCVSTVTTPTSGTYYACKSADCNEITVDNTTRGGTTANTKLYKKSGDTKWYSDSSCQTAVTTTPRPSKTNATFSGYYTSATNTTTRVGTNANPSVLSTTWTVTGPTTIYAHYNCNTGWQEDGTDIAGTCIGTITATASDKVLTYNGTNGNNGTAQSCANVTVTTPASGASVTYATKTGTACGTYGNAPTLTNVNDGPKTICYKVTATNYETVTGEYTCSMNKANGNVVLSATSGSTVYPNTKTFNVTTNKSGGALSATPTSGNVVATASVSGTTVTATPQKTGTQTITVTSAETVNYNAATATYELTVTDGGITHDVSDVNKVYDGTPLVCNGVTNVVPSGAEVKYRTATSGAYNLTSVPSITNVADSKTIYYQITADSYATVTGQFNCTVTKADCPITVKEGNTTLTSSSVVTLTYPTSKTLTATSSCGNAVTLSSGNTAYITVSDKTLNPVKVTSSNITMTASVEESANYNGATASFKAKVNRGDCSITLNPTSGTITYPTENTATFAINKGSCNGTITASSSDEDIATVALNSAKTQGTVSYVAPGTATITVSSAQTDQYNAESATYEVTNQLETYTITFKTGNKTMGTQSCTYGQNVTLNDVAGMSNIPVATNKGWGFNGWANNVNTNNTDYANQGSMTCGGNVTLYGVWKRDVKFTYFETAASTTNKTSTNQQYYRNTTISAAGVSGVTTYPLYAQSNYAWSPLGWATTTGATSASISQTDATTTTVTPGATTGTSAGVAYYAVYSRTPQIAYNGNGNTGGSTANTNCAEQTFNAGATNGSTPTCTLANNGFTRTGYTFNKWAAGSAAGIQYAAGDSYTFANKTWTSAKTYTMYANWTANTYSIAYTLNGGAYGASHPASATFDATFTVNNPTHEHATFKGWNISGMDTTTHTYGNESDNLREKTGVTATTFKNLRSTSGTVTFTATWNCDTGYAGTNCDAIDYNMQYVCSMEYPVGDGVFVGTGTPTAGSNPITVHYLQNNVVMSGQGTCNYEFVGNDASQSCSDCFDFAGWTIDAESAALADPDIMHNANSTVNPWGRTNTTDWCIINTDPENELCDEYSANDTFLVRPVYTPKQYNIEYMYATGPVSGASANMPASYTYTTETTISNADQTAPAHATFNGWCTGANGTGTCFAAGQPITIGNRDHGDMRYYANWSCDTGYTLTYDANNQPVCSANTYNIDYVFNGGAIVPSEYTPVEYIQGNGSSYIDTGVVPSSNYVVQTKIQTTGSLGSGVKMVYGARNAYKNKGFGLQYLSKFYLQYNNVDQGGTIIPAVNTVYNIEQNANKVYVNGTLLGNTPALATFAPTATMSIFGMNNAGTTTASGRFKLFNFKMKDSNGNLKFNGIPVKYGDVCGLYDTVSETFLPSESGTAFTCPNTEYTGGYPDSYTYGIGADITGVPTRAHSTFVGWCENSGLTNNCVTPQNVSTTAMGDKTFWAKWTCNAGYTANAAGTACNPNTIELSYRNGGHGTAPTAPASCVYGESVNLPAAITATGYTFNKWAVADNNFAANATIVCNSVNLGVTSGTAIITATWTTDSITCAAKKYLPAGATVCVDCIAGAYCPGGTFTYNPNLVQGITVCAINTYSNAAAAQCTACLTANGYQNSGDEFADHAYESSCKTTCAVGQCVATARAACANVGTTGWATGGVVPQGDTLACNVCQSGTSTCGYGACADEAGDCGRVLHVGANKVYLRSDRKTDRTLNVKIGNNMYYANMSPANLNMSNGVNRSFKIKVGNAVYSVYDDSAGE